MSLLRRRKRVLNGISLAIRAGDTTAVLGESGSGKTTLARCIAGITEPDSGSIDFEGINLFPRKKERKRVGTAIQMVFQNGSASLDPCMTVRDSLLEALRTRDMPKTKAGEEAQELVLSVGMGGEHLACLPDQLSGGQRQRVAIARALAAMPRLLILDEPTSALDALTAAQLHSLLISQRDKYGFSILYITHDIRTALSFCDRVVILHDGVIVEEGTTGDIARNPRHEFTLQLLRDFGST